MITMDIHKNLHGSKGEMTLDVKLEIQKGDFVALMGESGSGKTTLLRILSGLENAEGNINVEGDIWLDATHSLRPQKREIGFVFQDYALFENMSVQENLLFIANNQALALELLEMTELSVLKERNVRGLSGGQKQRVSLCRAMMSKPKILLMDEPLSALDPDMRQNLQKQIKHLHERFGTTTIMVSHDLNAVFSLASRVVMLEHGCITEDGTLKEVLHKTNISRTVEVLAIEQKQHATMATVSVLGELLEVEVTKETTVGQLIEIKVNGECT